MHMKMPSWRAKVPISSGRIVHVLPFLQRLVITLKKNYELPKDKFPNLLLWLVACMSRDSVKESSMSKEKTIEVYTRFVDSDYQLGGLNKNKQ